MTSAYTNYLPISFFLKLLSTNTKTCCSSATFRRSGEARFPPLVPSVSITPLGKSKWEINPNSWKRNFVFFKENVFFLFLFLHLRVNGGQAKTGADTSNQDQRRWRKMAWRHWLTATLANHRADTGYPDTG